MQKKIGGTLKELCVGGSVLIVQDVPSKKRFDRLGKSWKYERRVTL